MRIQDGRGRVTHRRSHVQALPGRLLESHRGDHHVLGRPLNCDSIYMEFTLLILNKV